MLCVFGAPFLLQEKVRFVITSRPMLAELKSDGGSLLYQDWLVVIGGLIGDVSDSAGVWWTKVLEVVDLAYGSRISSSPIDRLRVEPVAPSELRQGQWTRVNLRVCSMFPGSIRCCGAQVQPVSAYTSL